MKNAIVLLSVLITLLCALLLLQEKREVTAAQARIAAVENRASAAAADQERRARRLEGRLKDSRLQTTQSAGMVEDLRIQLAQAGTNQPKHKTVSDIFKDQLMVEALKAEAREGREKNIQRLFEDGLTDQLHLTEDQAGALRKLLSEKMEILWEKMFLPMAVGEMDEAAMAQAGPGLKQQFADNAARIRSLLGDDGYKAFQWFDQTQNERETVRKFAEHEAAQGTALTQDELNQLMDVMTRQRTTYRMQSDFGDPEKIDFAHWSDNFSDDKISEYGKGLGQVNAQIIQQSQAFLTPDQTLRLQQSLAQEALRGMMVVQSTKAMMNQGGAK